MARQRTYPIIRFLIGSFYSMAILALLLGAGLAAYLVVGAGRLRAGQLTPGPISGLLQNYTSSELYLAAAFLAGAGLIAFLLLGAVGQILAMLHDRAVDTSTQVQLLEDILELNEEVAKPAHPRVRVDVCEGCARLASLHEIDSGQWVCRECRRQLRSA